MCQDSRVLAARGPDGHVIATLEKSASHDRVVDLGFEGEVEASLAQDISGLGSLQIEFLTSTCTYQLSKYIYFVIRSSLPLKSPFGRNRLSKQPQAFYLKPYYVALQSPVHLKQFF